jgi:hypothetical protein
MGFGFSLRVLRVRCVCVCCCVCVEARLLGIFVFICGQLIVVFLYTAVSSVMVLSVITACCFLFVCSSV